MKIAFTTDWHLTDRIPISRTPETFLEYTALKLRTLLSQCVEEKVEMLFHGGDLFDVYKPSVQFINFVLSILQEFKIPIVLVVGNHDVPGYNLNSFDSESAIGILNKLKYIRVYNALDSFDTDLVRFQFVPIQAKHSLEQYCYKHNKPVICITHNSISNVSVPFEHIRTDHFKGKDFTNTLFLCGHIHSQFDVRFDDQNVRFLNPGCLIRTSIDEKDIIPRFYTIDIESGGWTVAENDLPLLLPNAFIERAGSMQLAATIPSFDSFIANVNQYKWDTINLKQYISELAVDQDVKNELLKRVGDHHVG